MRPSAPIRFLTVLVAGWVALRVSMFVPGWLATEAKQAPPEIAWGGGPVGGAAPVSAAGVAQAGFTGGAGALAGVGEWSGAVGYPGSRGGRDAAWMPAPRTALAPALPALRPPIPEFRPAQPLANRPIVPGVAAPPPLLRPAGDALPSRRWSGSAWLLARAEGGSTLAPGGVLGGSQAGLRLLYRLNNDVRRPLSLSGRVYLPLRRPQGAEAAVGLDWRPSARVPVHVLVERRQRLGREGRSAFALTVYGGGSADLGSGWRLDGYAQAGIVGLRSRDAFVDASARVSRRVGPVEVGGAVWGAAQPGASRLDIGPHVTVPLRVGNNAYLRLSAEYRFRIAGDARPGSGPALTLGVDF